MVMPLEQVAGQEGGPEAGRPVSVPAPAPGEQGEQVYLLFIQQARRATLRMDSRDSLNGTLTLTGVSPQTVQSLGRGTAGL